jgi:hypothetical protein
VYRSELFYFVLLLHRVAAEYIFLKHVSIDVGLLSYCTCLDAAATATDMRRLTKGMRSEKCVVKRFCRANIIV